LAKVSNNLKTEALATEFQKITYTEEARTPNRASDLGLSPTGRLKPSPPTSDRLPEDRG